MAFPRVFISSTCYDLGEIRDSLVGFIQSYQYEPILSEKGDIFYHPDLHTHESCVNEISNCHLLILVIGGRFGGKYTADISKSITNAEYNAAKKLNIPVFSFIKREVIEDHRVYINNKKSPILDQIVFPSIEKQEYAKYIFEFINEVRTSDVNNGFFSFEYAKDIKELLGRQWAGMMCDFLNKRIKEKEQNAIKIVLDNLTLVNKKTEEILENIYKKVDAEVAVQKIEEIDTFIESSRIFTEILQKYDFNQWKKRGYPFKKPQEIAQIDPNGFDLPNFLCAAGSFTIDAFTDEPLTRDYYLTMTTMGMGILWKTEKINAQNEVIEVIYQDNFDELQVKYNNYFKRLDLKSRKSLFENLEKNNQNRIPKTDRVTA